MGLLNFLKNLEYDSLDLLVSQDRIIDIKGKKPGLGYSYNAITTGDKNIKVEHSIYMTPEQATEAIESYANKKIRLSQIISLVGCAIGFPFFAILPLTTGAEHYNMETGSFEDGYGWLIGLELLIGSIGPLYYGITHTERQTLHALKKASKKGSARLKGKYINLEFIVDANVESKMDYLIPDEAHEEKSLALRFKSLYSNSVQGVKKFGANIVLKYKKRKGSRVISEETQTDWQTNYSNQADWQTNYSDRTDWQTNYSNPNEEKAYLEQRLEGLRSQRENALRMESRNAKLESKRQELAQMERTLEAEQKRQELKMLQNQLAEQKRQELKMLQDQLAEQKRQELARTEEALRQQQMQQTWQQGPAQEQYYPQQSHMEMTPSPVHQQRRTSARIPSHQQRRRRTQRYPDHQWQEPDYYPPQPTRAPRGRSRHRRSRPANSNRRRY